MKTTQNSPHSYKSPRFLIALLLWALILAGLIVAFIYIWQHPLEETGLFQEQSFKILYLFPIGFCILLLACWPFSAIAGIWRAHRQIKTEEQATTVISPYKFYRKLPNPYGIGVASLLCNSKIENEKDIVAVILDLCAQKYLHLSKHSDHYVIRVQPNPGKTPLANEAYILELIRKNQIAEIDYQRWYNLCVEDGVELSLYRPRKAKQLPQAGKIQNRVPFFLFIAIGAFLAGMIVRIFLPDAEVPTGILAIILFLAVIALSVNYLYVLFSGLKRISRTSAHINYKIALENQLRRTPKGTEELQKLYAFKNFLAQFNTFVDKNPESVVLWNRYLSYAQVFGLAKELMQSGYQQLIDNATFQIDNIDNISLSKLQLAKPEDQSSPS